MAEAPATTAASLSTVRHDRLGATSMTNDPYDAIHKRNVEAGRVLGRQECQNEHPKLIRAARVREQRQHERRCRLAYQRGLETGARVGVIAMGVVALAACWGKR